jgi:hypothetical protein
MRLSSRKTEGTAGSGGCCLCGWPENKMDGDDEGGAQRDMVAGRISVDGGWRR